MNRAASDDGSIIVLIIGYTAIAAVLIVVGIDVSKVFLARRALAAAADTAALAAAQGVDTDSLYAGAGPRCGRALPLDEERARTRASDAITSSRTDLRHTFVSISSPATRVTGATVEVTVGGAVAVPFGRVLAWLDPARSDGLVHVTESSYARSPVAGGGC